MFRQVHAVGAPWLDLQGLLVSGPGSEAPGNYETKQHGLTRNP